MDKHTDKPWMPEEDPNDIDEITSVVSRSEYTGLPAAMPDDPEDSEFLKDIIPIHGSIIPPFSEQKHGQASLPCSRITQTACNTCQSRVQGSPLPGMRAA